MAAARNVWVEGCGVVEVCNAEELRGCGVAAARTVWVEGCSVAEVCKAEEPRCGYCVGV